MFAHRQAAVARLTMSHVPRGSLNPVLDIIVDELLQDPWWIPGSGSATSANLSPEHLRVALTSVCSDWPARAKICGFYGHGAIS